ncbi:MAG: TIM44-like domain-containing protein [Ruminiclostridium sp.]|nr:TIM44-like domain-containing protein [Ruminiclostridium sp.]
MKRRIVLVIALLLSAVMVFGITAGAFDANDYDYSYDGGGSDWGGSSDWDNDRDYSYSGGSSYSGSGGGGGGAGIIVPIVIIIVIVVLINMSKKNNGGSGNNGNTGGGVRPANGGQGLNVNVPDRTSQIEQIIKAEDPAFTADDFTSFVKEVYIDIQTAWCKRDLTPVRPVLHTNLYNTTSKQVQSKIDQGVTYHYESIAINTAYLTSYVRDNEYEYLTAYLNARYIDYQTDDKTGNVIRGDKNTRWDFRYKMKFMRSVGVKTTSSGDNNMIGHNCPNCGAPLTISSTGVCEFCGSTVTTGLYSWVLSDFSTVRNDTQDDGIRVPGPSSDGSNAV